MATTPTPPTTHTTPKPKPTTPIWIVSIDGNSPTEVAAETLEISDAGILVFSTDKGVVRAVAVGHWTTVELKPPPETTPA